jgi:hypothetical protein
MWLYTYYILSVCTGRTGRTGTWPES